MAHELQILGTKRLGASEIAAQAADWQQRTELTSLLNAVTQIVLVLNDCNQIVYANDAALSVTDASLNELVGKRLGESLACERAMENQAGCGSSPGCTSCGALRSVAECADHGSHEHDCRLLQFGTGRALHFRVATKPITVNGQRFAILTLTDISHEQRRRNLERIFFHDLLNTAGAMSGYLQLLDTVPDDEREQMSQSLLRLVDTLVDEIRSQRDLVLAENGDLPVRPTELSSLAVLKEVVSAYRGQPLATGKFVFVAEGTRDVHLLADRGLLLRVLGNLVKNALEASIVGDHVLVGCESVDDDQVDFWVQNRAVMPRDVQLQLFHRAFTTKGSGRGLGTYSVKLLTTRYLQGDVSFTSTPDHGTRFRIALPKRPPIAKATLVATVSALGTPSDSPLAARGPHATSPVFTPV